MILQVVGWVIVVVKVLRDRSELGPDAPLLYIFWPALSEQRLS